MTSTKLLKQTLSGCHMTAIDELAELRQQVHLMLAVNAKLRREFWAAEKERDELRTERTGLICQVSALKAEMDCLDLDAIPEGCTPADARVLREANHALAAENDELRARVAALNSVCGRFSNIAYNVSQLDRGNPVYQSLKELQIEFDRIRANQIEGGE